MVIGVGITEGKEERLSQDITHKNSDKKTTDVSMKGMEKKHKYLLIASWWKKVIAINFIW